MAKLLLLARVGAVCVAAVIAVLSLSPADPDSSGGFPLVRALAAVLLGDPEQQDKVGHFLAYAALAACLKLALPGRTSFQLLMGCTAYGALFELLQAGMPGRYASLADMAANMSGAVLGLVVSVLLLRLLKGAYP